MPTVMRTPPFAHAAAAPMKRPAAVNRSQPRPKPPIAAMRRGACSRRSPSSAQSGADARRAGRGVRRYRHQPALRHAPDRAGGRRPRCRAGSRSMASLSLIFWALIDRGDDQICRSSSCAPTTMAKAACWRWRRWRIARRSAAGVKTAIGIAAMLGLALFYGDGMLTPAISVLSALEGLSVGRAALSTPLVVPLTLVDPGRPVRCCRAAAPKRSASCSGR